MRNEFLEFIAAKFDLDWFFIWFVFTKNKITYNLHNALKHDIYTVFKANT